MEIDPADLEVTYFRGSGPGGQHRNKRETGVRIRHVPTCVIAQASERRERPQNHALAMHRLKAELERRSRPRKARKKTRPTRASILRRLAAKTRRGRIKRNRRRPPDE